MHNVIYNNKIILADALKLSVTNRAFLYGDGLFESIKVINGKVFHFEAHYARILAAANCLMLHFDYSERAILTKINQLLKINKINAGGRIRITVYRDTTGKFLPDSNDTSFIIQAEKDNMNGFDINDKGLKLGWYNQQLKSTSTYSNFKTINALPSVLGAVYARSNSYDDVILFNTENTPIESTNANLFIVKDNTIFTTPLSSGCVDGTMRKLVMSLKKVTTKHLTKEMILNADEVFLTNAIQGIKLVKFLEGNRYNTHEKAIELISKISTLI